MNVAILSWVIFDKGKNKLLVRVPSCWWLENSIQRNRWNSTSLNQWSLTCPRSVLDPEQDVPLQDLLFTCIEIGLFSKRNFCLFFQQMTNGLHLDTLQKKEAFENIAYHITMYGNGICATLDEKRDLNSNRANHHPGRALQWIGAWLLWTQNID